MRMVQRPVSRVVLPAPAVAHVQPDASTIPASAPSPAPAEPVAQAVAQPATQATAEPEPATPVPPPRTHSGKASPLEPRRPAASPVRVHRAPVEVAQVQPPPSPPATLTPGPAASASPVPATPAPATQAPAPEPVQETPAPLSIPPARPEPENATPLPPPAPEPHRVTLNAGTLISVRLVDGLSSERNAPGDTFLATLDRELVADGFVIAERGARVEGRVVATDRGSKVRGGASLAVELTRVHTSDGQNVAIATDPFAKHAQQSRSRDAETIGAGAALGAIVGALGGGGKGAAIGAGVGGGAGAGAVVLTREPARLASETRVTFRLRQAVALTERMN